MNKIQENLQKVLSNTDFRIVSSGQFTSKDFNNLYKVINNTEEDFLIFDNGGGRKFDIMFDRTLLNEDNVIQKYEVVDFINHLLEHNKSWIYSYQINKKQTIIQTIR